MSRQLKVFFPSVTALLLLILASCLSTPAQDQTYGVWKVPNSQTPGIEFRAKCNSDINDSQGRTKSDWSFQFRSTYKGSIDFIYLNEAGIAQPPANKMIGPFLDTLKPGEIYENGAELYGGCSQHGTVTTGIHVTIKCAVPTGQDAPCFKDSAGNPFPRRDSSGSRPSSVGSNRASSQPKPIGGKLQIADSVWLCNPSWSAAGQQRKPRKWKITLNADHTVTAGYADGDASEGWDWSIEPTDKWTQNGNEVSWGIENGNFHFSGVISGQSLALHFTGGPNFNGTGPDVTGTAACTFA